MGHDPKYDCANCRHCDLSGHCEIKGGKVSATSTCPEFEEK